MARSLRVALILGCIGFAFPLQVRAAPKKLSALFPEVSNVSTIAMLHSRSSPEYIALEKCRKSTAPSTDCDVTRLPRAYRLGDSVRPLEEPFQMVNRCIELHPNAEMKISRGDILLSGGNVECRPQGQAVHIAHVVVCYEKSVGVVLGAHCSIATACFEGDQATGRCVRDYQGEEVTLPKN